MTPAGLHHQLAQYPRYPYATYPTPLEPLSNLSQQLNHKVWIKRDDHIGPATGGNKGRKLEFLMADAVQQGKSKVITYGGLQSNHARMTASACAKLGLQAHLFFFERRPARLEGNLLLDDLLGAHLHFIPFGTSDEPSFTLETTNRLVRLVSWLLVRGKTYFMPVGGHTVIGCLGYVMAALELHEQVMELGLEDVVVVVPAGTGGTLAGLLAGFTFLNSPIRVLGLDIGKLWKGFPASLATLASDICTALGQPHTFTPSDIPLIERTYAGTGYAKLNNATRQAITTLAQSEGILLDPVYTGKAFAGLLDLCQKGHFAPSSNLIFLHTGGYPGMWAYSGQLVS